MLKIEDDIYLGAAKSDSGGGSVNNQNKTVTENGVYTADEGYTGLGTVTVNVPSSGDVVTALNNTGAAVVEGDKVFLNYQSEVKDASANETTTVYNLYPCISTDGNYITYASASNKCGIKHIDSISDGTFTIITSDGLYQYSSYTTTFFGVVRYSPQNKAIRSYYNKMDEISGNWYDATGTYLGFDLGANTLNGNSSNIYLLDMNNGAHLTTISAGFNYNADSSIAVSPTEIYCIDSANRYYITVDRENNTATRTNLTILGTISGEVCMLGATTDKKYLIGTTSFLQNTAQYLRIVEIVEAGQVKLLSANDVIPEMAYWMTHNAAYGFTFNPNNGVLCCSETNSQNYGFYQYDSTTHTWSVLNIDLSGVLGAGEVLYGQISVSADLSRALIPYAASGTTSIYNRVVSLKNNNGFVAVAYSWPEINGNSLSGFVTTGGNAGTEIEVATITPAQLSVAITTNADDAEISGGLE